MSVPGSNAAFPEFVEASRWGSFPEPQAEAKGQWRKRKRGLPAPRRGTNPDPSRCARAHFQPTPPRLARRLMPCWWMSFVQDGSSRVASSSLLLKERGRHRYGLPSPFKRPVPRWFWDNVFSHRPFLFPHLILKKPVFCAAFIHWASLLRE